MSATPEREARIFSVARKLPVEERAFYLAGACAGDAVLRERIEELLGAHDAAGGFLAELTTAGESLPRPGITPAAASAVREEFKPSEQTGETIGRYRLLEKIGEGGCGVVYVAEQKEPVRRRVALKVIKLGMDTRSVIARFEAERQALALMDHPNIAKVLDAGSTEAGRPYFVMELVRGVRITEYCDQHNLSTRQRLDLFLQVCRAIEHAHQKGIIHRDIKPSNILVTVNDGAALPIVIDFGIAKATSQQQLTDKTLYTAFEQFLGTPAYMSPEQAEMTSLDIDTRSDVYALGVLLYELLTGKTPFDPKTLLAAGLDEMRRIIREQEPVRPSTRLATMVEGELTTTAQHRRSEPPKLIHLLRGDLDWIVMKCLEKDRARRYETANALAQDLERHLNHEPVTARPPSTGYRAQKFVRRNRVMVTAVAAITAALVLGTVISTWQAWRANLQRDRAEANEQKAVTAMTLAQQAQRRAQANELLARQQAYAADINLAQRATGANDLGLAWELLNRYRPEVQAETRPSLRSGGTAAGGIPKSEAESTAHVASHDQSTGNPPPSTDLRHWEWRHLWQLCQSEELFTLCRETSSISVVQASPDGKVLAVRRRDGRVVLWDWAARRRLPELPLLAGDIAVNPFASSLSKDIAFFPFGRVLAIGSADPGGRHNMVVLWDSDTGSERGRFPHRAAIASLAASPDGQFVAIFDVDRHVTILDVQSRQACASLAVSPPVWLCDGVVRFSPDGERLAVGDNDGTIHVWHWRSGVDMKIPPQPPADGIMALAWSPTEPLLASTGGYGGRAIRLWNPLTGRPAGELPGHTDWIRELAFSTNGEFLASASADRTVRAWRVSDRTELRRFLGHRDEVWAVAFLPDGKTLVSGDREGTVRFWSLDASRRSPSHQELPERVSPPPDNVLAFAPDGRTFVTACRDGRVRVWSTQPGRAPEQLEALGTNNYALDFSPDGRWLAVADRAGAVRIWDWPVRRALTNLPMPSVKFGILAFTPRGQFLWAGLVLTNYARAGRIWETGTWRELPPAPIDYSGMVTASVSPDEKLLAASYMSGQVKLWRVPDGHLEHTFPGQAFFPPWLAFAPGGRTLAAANTAGFVQLWDVLERRPLDRFEGHRNALRGPAFSADGRRLAAAGGDSREALKLWDMATLRELIVLPARGRYFMRTAFSPDGNTLVAIDADGVTHLWHAPSFAEIEAVEREAKGAGSAGETEGAMTPTGIGEARTPLASQPD